MTDPAHRSPAGHRLLWADDFRGDRLDPDRWIPHYLPHWTTPDRSAARYRCGAGGLELLIAADQPAWREEDGPMRVSNLQTGSFSGPVGSPVGQHRHRPDLTVRTAQPERRLGTPSAGLVEVELAADADPTTMLAAWLVGFEAEPEQSGEICLAELYGADIGPGRSRVTLGVKAHHDPRLVTAMTDEWLDLDARELHTYAAQWGPDGVALLVDGRVIRRLDQVLDYPLQLMVDLFEFPTDPARPSGEYPKVGRVGSVRVHRREVGEAGPTPAGS